MMKIRLTIGIKDNRYLDKLSGFLELNHLDRLELATFSGADAFLKYAEEGETDVFLMSDDLGIAPSVLAGKGKVIILCDEIDSTENESEVVKISKYKKPELIFKDILAAFAETGHSSTQKQGSHRSGSATRVIMSTSFSGGTGASVFAAAFAKRLAASASKVLYLSFSPLGESCTFFQSESENSFGEVIFAIKSKNIDLGTKMEAVVNEDNGVSFFSSAKNAMDMLELSAEDKKVIVSTLVASGKYEYIILDENFELSEAFVQLMSLCDRIILVNNGEKTANQKFVRTKSALAVMEKMYKVSVLDKMCLIYNRFSSSCSSEKIEHPEMAVLGTIPPVTHATLSQVIEFIQNRDDVFENI